MVEKFLEYLSVERRYSPNTVAAYRRDLAGFVQFLQRTEGHDDLKRIDRKVARNFIYELGADGISKRSINRKLSALRAFYRFLLRLQEIETSPVEDIPALQFYPEQRVPMSEREMTAVTDAVSEDVLAAAIIETLYQTGMRKSELCNLKPTDVDFSARQLLINGKGNKQRLIPMTPPLHDLLEKYAHARQPLQGHEEFFFVNRLGKKLTAKFVYLKVNSYLSSVSSKPKTGPHILRHTFATHMMDRDAGISEVKKILGHESLASTQVYTHTSIEKLKKVFNLAHPRGRKKDEL